MKGAFRQSMAWLHTWAGLVVGWLLYFIFLTGTLGYFDTEIDRWMRPELPLASAQPTLEDSVAIGLRRLEAAAPGAQRWVIRPPAGREVTDLTIFYQQHSASTTEILDATTGQPIRVRDTGGGQVLYQMHYLFHYLPRDVAYWIVEACAMFMLLAIVSGVIIHKKIFREFFTFRPRKGQRSWLDAHNLLSVAALPFHVMITYSGLIFLAVKCMPLIVSATYGPAERGVRLFAEEFYGLPAETRAAGKVASLTSFTPVLAQATQRCPSPQTIEYIDIRYPGDANARITIDCSVTTLLRGSQELRFDGVSGRLLEAKDPIISGAQGTRDVFIGLHEGLFAGPLLRWLYFFSGALGTAMIGAGLVLWTTKRRAKLSAQEAAGVGLIWVERLNIGTIIGLPIGIAAYFWANRLIPAAVAGRAQWEVHSMFIVWAVMLVHAHLRARTQAWREQLWLAAAAFVLLPVVGLFTTEHHHLGATLPRGDWAIAGMDLMLLLTGFVFAATAMRLQARQQSAEPILTHAPAENL